MNNHMKSIMGSISLGNPSHPKSHMMTSKRFSLLKTGTSFHLLGKKLGLPPPQGYFYNMNMNST